MTSLGVILVYLVIGLGLFLWTFNLAEKEDVAKVTLDTSVWQFVFTSFVICVFFWPIILYFWTKDSENV
jgi:hypothetical protein